MLLPPDDPILSFTYKDHYLSNFYERPLSFAALLIFEGVAYRSSEAAYQAQKDVTRAQEFSRLGARDAQRLGQVVTARPDWDDVKLDIMRAILKAKFDQNPELKARLLATGERHLEEGNTWHDVFWGTCHRKGLNHLGKLLMKLRAFYVLEAA